MSRADFIEIAKGLNRIYRTGIGEYVDGVQDAIEAVATALARRAPNFDKTKFLEACFK